MISAHQTANNSAQIEDYPEPRDESALEFLRLIGHHDCALRGPENACTAPKQEAGKHNVAQVMSVIVAQIRADVDTIPNATKREGESDAKGVGNSTGEETDNSKSSVQCRI